MTLRDVDFSGTKDIEQLSNVHQDSQSFEYIYIGNIPQHYKSSVLRSYFSAFVECSAFSCFHYRHRPEIVNVSNYGTDNTLSPSDKSPSGSIISGGLVTNEKTNSAKDNPTNTCCCVVKVNSSFVESFISKYHKRLWKTLETDRSLRCIAKKMKVSQCNDFNKIFKCKSELKLQLHYEDQTIYEEDLKTFIELNPPTGVMPNGNVGTPTKYFHQLIKECKLPCSVIKSLGITFPRYSKQKEFSRVEIDYDYYFKKGRIQNFRSFVKNRSTSVKDFEVKNNGNPMNIADKSAENYNTDKNEEDDAEDWERYEALYDDIDNQARPKEKLYEEDLELKWEKGGSGLVFYTDSYFWNEMKGKDFDEDTVDDWDVDYSVYYEDGAGDKPARDQLQMRIERRRRAGKDVGPIRYSEIKRQEKHNREKMNAFAKFEKHSKGIGSKYLKQRGWKEGSGIGALFQGIPEPITTNGQSAREHVGLGYYGEKLDRSISLKRIAERDVYISTKYDQKDGESINAMRFEGKELLKYRAPPISFEKKQENKE